MTVDTTPEPAELIVLRAVLLRVRQELRADNATIAVPDLEPGYVRTVASATGHPGELWRSRFALRDGVAGEVLATRQVVIANDVESLPQFRHLGGRPIKSILAAPVVDGERVRGVITVTSGSEGAFSDQSLSALQDLLPYIDAALALSERAAWGVYLAGLAHDVSTPVSSLRGFLQMMTGQTSTMPRMQLAEHVQLASIAVDQLVHLVGDMHDVLSMSRHSLRLGFSTFNAATTIQTLLATFQLLAEEAGVQLGDHLQEDVLLMYGDRHRIERILSNLIQNALRFTPVGGRVIVSLERAGDHTVRMVVDDDGPGLADADLPHLFDLNYQSAVSGRRAGYSHGLGLGLAIARMLARAHGGELTAGNRVGGGARFALWLPIMQPGDGQAAPRVAFAVPNADDQALLLGKLGELRDEKIEGEKLRCEKQDQAVATA
jgi:signal transduction histidine kinase